MKRKDSALADALWFGFFLLITTWLFAALEAVLA